MQTLEFRADDITVLKSEFCPATRCLIDLAAFFTFAFFLKMFILSALHFLLLSMPLYCSTIYLLLLAVFTMCCGAFRVLVLSFRLSQAWCSGDVPLGSVTNTWRFSFHPNTDLFFVWVQINSQFEVTSDISKTTGFLSTSPLSL